MESLRALTSSVNVPGIIALSCLTAVLTTICKIRLAVSADPSLMFHLRIQEKQKLTCCYY